MKNQKQTFSLFKNWLNSKLRILLFNFQIKIKIKFLFNIFKSRNKEELFLLSTNQKYSSHNISYYNYTHTI